VSARVDLAIQNLALLRATERTSSDLAETLEPVSEQLYEIAGATVPRATAARLLGVSQPALDRWIDLGEIPAVLTPAGRRAISVDYLVEFLDDVRAARETGHTRALKFVIDERRRQAATIELADVLDANELASVGGHGHRGAELRSLAYHRLVARRLDTSHIRRARRRLESWTADGKMPAPHAATWRTLLQDGHRDDLVEVIAADTQESSDLRQSTPFAGAISEQERTRLFELIRHAAPASVPTADCLAGQASGSVVP